MIYKPEKILVSFFLTFFIVSDIIIYHDDGIYYWIFITVCLVLPVGVLSYLLYLLIKGRIDEYERYVNE